MVDEDSDESDPEMIVVPSRAGSSAVLAAVKGSVPRPRPRSVLESGRLADEPSTDERHALEEEDGKDGE